MFKRSHVWYLCYEEARLSTTVTATSSSSKNANNFTNVFLPQFESLIFHDESLLLKWNRRLTPTPSVCLSVCLSPSSFCLSLCLKQSLSISMSLSSFCLSLCLKHSLSILFLPFSVCLSLCVWALFVYLISTYFSLFVFMFKTVFVYLYVSLSSFRLSLSLKHSLLISFLSTSVRLNSSSLCTSFLPFSGRLSFRIWDVWEGDFKVVFSRHQTREIFAKSFHHLRIES